VAEELDDQMMLELREPMVLVLVEAVAASEVAKALSLEN
jgi:hypothetical protein